MSFCEKCGSIISENFQFCPSCGCNRNPIDQISLPTRFASVCPFCKYSEGIKKVSEIYRQGISEISGYAPVSQIYSDGEGNVYSTTAQSSFHGVQISNLAQDLQPPIAPKIPKKTSAGTKWGLGILIFMGVLAYTGFGTQLVENWSTSLLAGSIIFTAFYLIIFFFWGGRRKSEVSSFPLRFQQYEETQKEYLIASQNWNALYYCSRDGHIFIPGIGTYAPIDKINEYLVSLKTINSLDE